MDRRLAAVLFADVVGYGQHSQRDEEGTRVRFRNDLHEVFEPNVTAYHGRLVKTIGDAVLVEFHSVVDAARCAVEIQRVKAERNAGVQIDRRLVYRIGINLGDVIVEGDDIHGDGVNIAERLQALARPGDVIISGAAYEQVEKKLEVGYESLGQQSVKNVDKPVRIYRLLLDSEHIGKTIQKPTFPSWRWQVLAIVAFVLVIASGTAAWWSPWEPEIEPASMEHMALPLPGKPSIAVLPFANMSDDPKQEYFADGITDDLITALSQVSGLFVISRNSTFVYKSKTVPPKQISEELGVRYVLEGSVQRAGDRLRINAQLIDALSGGHAWADRFDGALTDVFSLQDRVTRSIADALSVRLTDAERESLGQQETRVPAAYEEFLRGWLYIRRDTPEDYRQGIPHLENAVRFDPDYGRAYAALAWAYLESYRRSWTASLGLTEFETRQRASYYLEEARKRPTNLYIQTEGFLLWIDGFMADALAKFEAAVAADPGDALSYVYMGAVLISLGRLDEAMRYIRTALRLDPHYPAMFMYFLGLAQFKLEKFAEAAEAFEAVTRLNPDDEVPFVALAAAYGFLGRKADAASAIARCNELRVKRGGVPITTQTVPWFSLGSTCNCSGDMIRVDKERIQRGLRLAGVPAYLSQSGEFSERNMLGADEIRSLIVGHRLHGRSPYTGEERAVSVTPTGVVTMSGEWVSGGPLTDGSLQFEGGELCYSFGVVRYCGFVLRNPGGTRAMENEYIWDSGSLYTFSQVE